LSLSAQVRVTSVFLAMGIAFRRNDARPLSNASAPYATISARAVFPDPLGPITATNPGLNSISPGGNQAASALTERIQLSLALLGLSGPMCPRFLGSKMTCLSPSKVGSERIQQNRFL